MLSRISIGCDETSRQVLPCSEEAAQVGSVPPASLCSSRAQSRWNMDGNGEGILGWAALSAEDALGLRQSPAGCAAPSLQPSSRGFSGSTDVQPCTSRLQWHRSLAFAGSAGAWTGDKETARVSDGREGQRRRKMGGTGGVR